MRNSGLSLYLSVFHRNLLRYWNSNKDLETDHEIHPEKLDD